MVLNPCWMPQAYVWLCWFICDRSSHQGPNYLFRTPCHLFPGVGAFSSSLPEPFSLFLHHYPHPSPCLAWIWSQSTLYPLSLLFKNLCLGFHNLDPAGLFSFALGVCFYTTEEHWVQCIRNLELPSWSLEFRLCRSLVGQRFHPQGYKGHYPIALRYCLMAPSAKQWGPGVGLRASRHDWRVGVNPWVGSAIT